MRDLLCLDAATDTRDADLVLTMPYGPLPAHLQRRPMLVAQFIERQSQLREWCGTSLTLVSTWNRGTEAVWVGNADAIPCDLSDLVPDDGGWFPLQLPRRLLREYARPGMVVWDGFMGRGTVGRACREMGLGFVGADVRPDRVELAKSWI